jgi:transposase
MRTHGKPKELEQLRLVAARMFEMQIEPKKVAKAVNRDVQTVRHWRRVWLKTGVEGLRAKPHPGRAAKLSAGQWDSVLQMLLRGPKEHGYDAYLWTTSLMARLIHEKFGVDYHHDYVGEMLHKLGWSCQKPTKRARERDEAAIALWKHQTWPGLLKKAENAMP